MPATLPQWFTVALPHSDIREGRLDESVFAANVWAVKQDNAPTTYLETAFGGGETHTQVALWQLARHPDVLRSSASCTEVRTVLGDLIPKQRCNAAVFSNQNL